MSRKYNVRLLAMVLVLAFVLSISAVSAGALADIPDVPVDREGAVFELTHRNPLYPTDGVPEDAAVANNLEATSALYKEIQKITYAEIQWFELNKLYVGLPYSAVDAVAALDTVEEVKLFDENTPSQTKPEDKPDAALREAIAAGEPDTQYNIVVTLSYTPAVYHGFCEEDFAGPDAYLAALRESEKQYFTNKNQEYYAAIAAKADVTLNEIGKFTPALYLGATADAIDSIAELEAVDAIGYISAEPLPAPVDDEYLCDEKFESWMYVGPALGIKYDPEIHGTDTSGKYFDYGELYLHVPAPDAEPDWALIQAYLDFTSPWEKYDYLRFGDRVLRSWTPGAAAHVFGYYVYDAAADTFYDIEQVSPGDYDGMAAVLDDLGIGAAMGDIDLDGEVNVFDVTMLQRYIAELELPDDPEYTALIADVDGDGEAGIFDATRIQRYLADMNDLLG